MDRTRASKGSRRAKHHKAEDSIATRTCRCEDLIVIVDITAARAISFLFYVFFISVISLNVLTTLVGISSTLYFEISPLFPFGTGVQMNVSLRSEGCEDPGKTGCGRAFMKVNNIEYSVYQRGFNVAVFSQEGKYSRIHQSTTVT